MKKLLSLSLAITLCVSAYSANVLLNSDFESNADWNGVDGGTFSYSTDAAHSGVQSVKGIVAGGWPSFAQDNGATTTGKAVTVSVWMFHPSSDPIISGNAGVKIQGDWNGGDIILEGHFLGSGSPQDTWIQYTANVDIPIRGSIQYVGMAFNASGTVYWDDFTVTPIPEPATFALIGLVGFLFIRKRG
ncbi:PEP-CTERM sorting domain-containing protein [bacterium]|nr:PEP-CTERM sorting domain-containing protein [bacterium]